VDKGPDAFRTISEVADDLDLPQHVLRFWETRFSQIKPMKRGGGRRYYRPDDIDLLRGIRHLLYGEGYTIKGVQRILRDSGVRHVMQVWQEDYQPDEGEPDAVTARAHAASADAEERGGEILATNGGEAATGLPQAANGGGGLGKDEVRHLKTTLFELLECKRLLDQVR